ncbi:MAG: Uma2 family endonuclease [Planctomycetes bacterium]|nr:Uma2 family endonuclease [Planctomycetota bacterium]
MTTLVGTKPLPGTTRDPLYPDSDGQPLGETGFHVRVLYILYTALRFFYRHRNDVYVAADMFFYYEKDNPAANKSPDLMVIKGVAGNHERRSFRVWEENVVPTVIFEITSASTWREDTEIKKATYERLGVAEYFLFDPFGEKLNPILQGFRLVAGEYVRLTPEPDGSLISTELNMRIFAEDTFLRLVDLQTGKLLLTQLEEFQRAEQEAERARQEARRAEEEKQRAEQEARRAEEEKQRAEQETRRAEEEKQRADALAAEVARLRTLLEQQGKKE